MDATVGVADGLVVPAARRSGRRWLAVAVVLGCLAALGIAAASLDSRYGPIRSGPFGGPYSEQGLVPSPDGFASRLADQPGATAQILESLSNAGSHTVTITAIDTDEVVTEVRWSELRTVPGGFISGISTPWHEFPARIPAHATIRLLVTIHRPAYCGQIGAGGIDSYDGYHRVHWRSLLRGHVSTVEDQVRTVHVC